LPLSLRARESSQFPGVRFRPDTNDDLIFRSIVEFDEYRLPESFENEDVVIDVGAHIGGFAYAALERGCGQAYCYEADEENARLCRSNLKQFGDRATVIRAAIWRSDQPESVVRFSRSSVEENQGGGNVIGRSGRKTRAVGLDEAIRVATRGTGRRIRMLKLDCEGAEFPILFTSSLLHLVDDIRGEVHEFWDEPQYSSTVEEALRERFTIENLAELLAGAGFHARWQRHRASSRLGYFFADRGGEARAEMLEGLCCQYCASVAPV